MFKGSPVKERLDKYTSIARNIIAGVITVDSVSDFDTMLNLFPDNPELHTALADLLAKMNDFESAARSYNKASELFLNSKMMLPAILSKIMAWRISKPVLQEARYFYSILREKDFPETPLRNFFCNLSYPELIAFTNRMARVRYPTGRVIKKIGDEETQLYLISAGTVRDTVYKPLERNERIQKKQSVYFYPDSVFGDIYPLEDWKLSQSYTETISGVELARISKKRLIQICRKYPNVDRALSALLEVAPNVKPGKSGQGQRKVDRHPMLIKIQLEIFGEGSDDIPFEVQGYTQDISVNGVCVVVDTKYAKVTELARSLPDSDIRISFPTDAMTLKVAGKVVWTREVLFGGDKTLALGICFNELTPKMGGMLLVFAGMLSGEP